MSREASSLPDNVRLVTHPLAQSILTELRDRNTGQIEFRKGLVKLGRLVALRIVEDMDVVEKTVVTPLGVEARGTSIPDMDSVVIVQVLRASMPFVEGMIKIFPKARMGVVSARRVEEKGMASDRSFEIEIKYVKVPRIRGEDTLIIADPMFATGSTAVAAIDKILEGQEEPKRLVLATVISTRLAIERVLQAHSKTLIYTVSVDPQINEKGYIVPGLGDAGDRAFGE